jgi:hypothetical protein
MFKLKHNQVKLTAMPDEDSTRVVKAVVTPFDNDVRMTFYLKLEAGEKDYTGYTKSRGGVPYRLHLVRCGFNAEGKPNREILLEPQDENLSSCSATVAEDYTLFAVATGYADLPIHDKMGHTVRKSFIQFNSAEELASWEDWISRKIEEDDNDIPYEIHTLQDGESIPLDWLRDRSEDEPELGTTVDDAFLASVSSPYKDWFDEQFAEPLSLNDL